MKITVWRTLALSSCSCAWRSASRRYASRSSSADRSESDGLLVYESADPCQQRVTGGYDRNITCGFGISHFITYIQSIYWHTLLSVCRGRSAVSAHISAFICFSVQWLRAGVHANPCLYSWTHSCVSLCVSTTQCCALPHQPSSATPNIAQRRQQLPLLSCLAPIHSIIPHSAAHIHPLFPCLFSKDISSLAKYMLAIIFHCKLFNKDISKEGRHIMRKASDKVHRDILHKVKWGKLLHRYCSLL